MKMRVLMFLLVLALMVSFAACDPANTQDTTDISGTTVGVTDPSDPTVPPTTEPTVPPTTEPTVPPTTEPTVPPTTEPTVPPTTEPTVPPTTEPVVPPTTEATVPPTTVPPAPKPTTPPVTTPPVTTPPATDPPVLSPVTRPETSAAEAALRQEVLDYMYEVCTIAWTPKVDIIHQCDHASHYQHYKAGVTYYGLPYTHLAGSLEKFKAYMNEDGTMDESHETIRMWGNDCADAVYWAWSQVSSDVTFTLTKNMICANGTLPVGGYQVTSTSRTDTIWKDNGDETMFRALAQLKPADAIVAVVPNQVGHVRMIAADPIVVYNADGTINPAESFLIIHEQGAGCDKLDTLFTTCKVNAKISFNSMRNWSYVPITISAFAEGKADPVKVTIDNYDTTKTGIGKGTIRSEHRIFGVKLQITDAQGNVVKEAVKYTSNANSGNTDVFYLSTLQLDLGGLTAGAQYTYEVLVGVSGEFVSVQKFDFIN